MVWMKKDDKVIGMQVNLPNEQVRMYHKECFSKIKVPDDADTLVITAKEVGEDEKFACDLCGGEIEVS